MTYLDAHTHRPWHPETVSVERIENIHQQSPEIDTSQTVSLGLHPWFITENWEKDWERMWTNAQHHLVLAIGETGLDRLCSTDWTLQQKVFQHQIGVANRLALPLIIHCVRAFPETLNALQKAKTPIVFHGFSGKYSRIEPAIKAGHFVSFGKAILHPESATRQALKQIPLNQILLETDGEDISIVSVYEAAAEIKELSLIELKENIAKNAQVVFSGWSGK